MASDRSHNCQFEQKLYKHIFTDMQLQPISAMAAGMMKLLNFTEQQL